MFTRNFCGGGSGRAIIVGAVIALGIATGAHAEPFVFTLQGQFYNATLSGTPIPYGTPFTAVADFDTSSPNIVAPIGLPGFVAYSPSSVSFTFNGNTYQATPYSNAVPDGLAVDIFDKTTPFPAVPEYGVGLASKPLGVPPSAGIIADFNAASPEFSASQLTTTTFPASAYVGTGNFPGTCLSNCNSETANIDEIDPIPLLLGATPYSLVLGEIVVNYDQALNDPNSTPGGVTISAYSTASLVDVPEPPSILLLGVSFGALLLVRGFRRA